MPAAHTWVPAGCRPAAISRCPPPADDAASVEFDGHLGPVREFSADQGRAAGLDPRRVTDLVIAVSEIAANALGHAGGAGRHPFSGVRVTRYCARSRTVATSLIRSPAGDAFQPTPQADTACGSSTECAISSNGAPARQGRSHGCICVVPAGREADRVTGERPPEALDVGKFGHSRWSQPASRLEAALPPDGRLPC